ncbi:uncharacterized protein RCC_04542 [Ramularia collo-cygni]|uniref:Uncharacterized protein n=1 Tax=Ramularia collo-cygni TaxID=112498 RepID=A0A2D3UU93_9PEZI|nr:uncharacterized protein RCC_04542 [Ramularia collo-cygni]CZT18698.1 uncharacterized protein RCC_04542 [Ramularia collo-cygni]
MRTSNCCNRGIPKPLILVSRNGLDTPPITS